MWQMLLTKHCACSANVSRIGPSQKNAARPNGSAGRRTRAATSGIWMRVHMRYAGVSMSLQYFETGAAPACQSQRRCDHQKPPMRGLEMSSGVSDFAWCSR